MRRRDFIKLLYLVTTAWPGATMAQQPRRIPLVAVLTPYEEAGKSVFTPISREEVEEQLTTGLGKRQVAEFVEDGEVLAGQVISNPAVASVATLGLEPVD